MFIVLPLVTDKKQSHYYEDDRQSNKLHCHRHYWPADGSARFSSLFQVTLKLSSPSRILNCHKSLIELPFFAAAKSARCSLVIINLKHKHTHWDFSHQHTIHTDPFDCSIVKRDIYLGKFRKCMYFYTVKMRNIAQDLNTSCPEGSEATKHWGVQTSTTVVPNNQCAAQRQRNKQKMSNFLQHLYVSLSMTSQRSISGGLFDYVTENRDITVASRGAMSIFTRPDTNSSQSRVFFSIFGYQVGDINRM